MTGRRIFFILLALAAAWGFSAPFFHTHDAASSELTFEAHEHNSHCNDTEAVPCLGFHTSSGKQALAQGNVVTLQSTVLIERLVDNRAQIHRVLVYFESGRSPPKISA